MGFLLKSYREVHTVCVICIQVSEVHYREAQALLLGFLRFRGAGGGAVERTTTSSCRTKLAAFSEHLHLALSALPDYKKKQKQDRQVLQAKCQKRRLI